VQFELEVPLFTFFKFSSATMIKGYVFVYLTFVQLAVLQLYSFSVAGIPWKTVQIAKVGQAPFMCNIFTFFWFINVRHYSLSARKKRTEKLPLFINDVRLTIMLVITLS